MKRMVLMFAVLGSMGAAALPARANDAGKGIFLAQKCNQCHTAKTAKIEISGTPEGQPVDLSAVSGKRTPDWMKAFLLKKEAINGTKHKRKFLGPDSDLGALVTWLATLKG